MNQIEIAKFIICVHEPVMKEVKEVTNELHLMWNAYKTEPYNSPTKVDSLNQINVINKQIERLKEKLDAKAGLYQSFYN